MTRSRGEQSRRSVLTGLTWILRDRVCGECNNGWMARLEDGVSPFLLPAMLGQPVVLEPEAGRRIAFWSAKTALLFQLKAASAQGQSALAPASNLEWLYAQRADPLPPPGCQVWLASTDARLGTAEAQVGWHTATTSLPPLDGRLFITVFAVGYLVVKVSGQAFDVATSKAPDGGDLLQMALPERYLTSVRSIWPARAEAVAWPPSSRIPTETLGEFARGDGSTVLRRTEARIPRVG
ncbi:MAG: hypothetical protein U0838_05775 [Chloroflexota bacterium]